MKNQQETKKPAQKTHKPGQPGRAKPSPRDQHREALLDEALEEPFPASDPPAITRPN